MKKIILLLLISCLTSFTFPRIYTVQVFSYSERSLEKAVEVANLLEKMGYKNVRIENINGILTIRVGRFKNFKEAKKLEKKLQRYFPSSFSRSAYYIGNRIVYSSKDKKVKYNTAPVPQSNSGISITKSQNTVIRENKSKAILLAENNSKISQVKEEKESIPEKEKNRFEISTSYEILDPSEPYTRWKNLNLSYYRIESDTFTFFLTVENLFREEGENTTIFTVGSYKNWTPSFYTYSSISAGTDSVYAPKFRFDNDFNFKFGENKNLIWTVGTTYIKYFDVHKDFILSTGFTWYLKDLILSYRIFRNESDPGSVQSFSHSVSLQSGREKWRWLYLTFSFGHQAYTATYLTTPEEIRKRSYEIVLGGRKWLGDNWGIFGNLSYFHLLKGYVKYGITSGIFTEF